MRTQICEVPQGQYTGYYWLSNSEFPVVVSGAFDNSILNNKLPFIVEAGLYNVAENTAVMIHHNGKANVIFQYNLSLENGVRNQEVCYEVQRLERIPAAKFFQIWKEEADALCAGMNVLKPYARVFAGFINH